MITDIEEWQGADGQVAMRRPSTQTACLRGMEMLPALTILMVLLISLLVVRVATVALTLTGTSRDLAQFQALSAFTGSGFTTRESEDMVNHPARRRIVMFLMLAGNAGIVLTISSVVGSFVNIKTQDDWYDAAWVRMLFLLGGVTLVLLLSRSRIVGDSLWRISTWCLKRWSSMDVHDYTRLLRLAHDFVVSELHVHQDDWLDGKTLAESQLASEGVLVLGIERADGHYIGAPRGVSRIQADDTLILYSSQDQMLNLIDRRADFLGNLQHVMAVTKHLNVIDEEQEVQDPKVARQSPDNLTESE